MKCRDYDIVVYAGTKGWNCKLIETVSQWDFEEIININIFLAVCYIAEWTCDYYSQLQTCVLLHSMGDKQPLKLIGEASTKPGNFDSIERGRAVTFPTSTESLVVPRSSSLLIKTSTGIRECVVRAFETIWTMPTALSYAYAIDSSTIVQ